MPDIVSIIVSFVSGSIGGAITGATVSHFLAKRRDAETRKHAAQSAAETRKLNFLGFMDGWRTEIERKNIRIVADQFNGKCAEFRTEATKIRSDHGPKFWRLVDSLSSLRSGEIEEGSNQGDNAPGRIKLLTRLDAVVNFVKAN